MIFSPLLELQAPCRQSLALIYKVGFPNVGSGLFEAAIVHPG
jgi:hypothetical protein